MKGNPLTLIGPQLQPGDHAPDFSVVDGSLSPVDLEKTGHNVRIISVVPSLDTPVTSGDLAFHYHSGGHMAVPADWKAFLDFTDAHFEAAKKR